MSSSGHKSAGRPGPDPVLLDIARYTCDDSVASELARETAVHCLMDALACAFQALAFPACTRLLGPVVPGATMAGGARVPGTSCELDPVITTTYRRATLMTGPTRATIDTDVTATAGDGRLVTMTDRVVVETKSDRAPSPIDRALWDLGIRPTTISKFAIGAAALFPELPSNKWARVLRDHVTLTGG